MTSLQEALALPPTCEVCGDEMVGYRTDFHTIVEPPQAVKAWSCSCGNQKLLRYEDDYLEGVINVTDAYPRRPIPPIKSRI